MYCCSYATTHGKISFIQGIDRFKPVKTIRSQFTRLTASKVPDKGRGSRNAVKINQFCSLASLMGI
jgi:hypothetical protein